jgi:hypothetical protein
MEDPSPPANPAPLDFTDLYSETCVDQSEGEKITVKKVVILNQPPRPFLKAGRGRRRGADRFFSPPSPHQAVKIVVDLKPGSRYFNFRPG